MTHGPRCLQGLTSSFFSSSSSFFSWFPSRSWQKLVSTRAETRAAPRNENSAGVESRKGGKRSTLRWPMPRSLETSRFRVDDHVNEIKGKGGGKDRRKVFVRFFFGNGIRTFMFSLGNLTSGWNAREEEKTRHPAYRIHQNSVGEIAPLSPGGKSARKIRGSWPRSGGRERCADCTEISKSHSRLGYPLAASGQTFKSASPATRGGERIVRARSLSAIVALFFFFFTYKPQGLYVKEIRKRERERGRGSLSRK